MYDPSKDYFMLPDARIIELEKRVKELEEIVKKLIKIIEGDKNEHRSK